MLWHRYSVADVLLLCCCCSHACMPACVPAGCCCRASGQSSQEKKKGLISKLLVASKGCEPGYIMRSLQVRHAAATGLAEDCGVFNMFA
jgi:hypothetical protein